MRGTAEPTKQELIYYGSSSSRVWRDSDVDDFTPCVWRTVRGCKTRVQSLIESRKDPKRHDQSVYHPTIHTFFFLTQQDLQNQICTIFSTPLSKFFVSQLNQFFKIEGCDLWQKISRQFFSNNHVNLTKGAKPSKGRVGSLQRVADGLRVWSFLCRKRQRAVQSSALAKGSFVFHAATAASTTAFAAISSLSTPHTIDVTSSLLRTSHIPSLASTINWSSEVIWWWVTRGVQINP